MTPRFAGLAAFAFAFAFAACGGPEAASPKRPLPSYDARSATLFDDAIEPRAVGLELDASSTPRSDPLLRERTQIGDAVVLVRVETVTVKREDTGTRYDMTFRVLQKLAGLHAPPETFVVSVEQTSPSAGILKSFEARIVSMKFIAFVRAFVRPDGDQDLHFHIAPDSHDVRAAVESAALLSELN